MEELLDKFANKLTTVRQKRGLTKVELAELSGIHAKTISRIENGKNIPKIDTIVKLLTAMGYELQIGGHN
ncbi:helix-turn-helix transcriptional regulator (plasmid) [Rossellomorea sp. AcN35-11]|nr:helix-turn-helix domain-containing protein [Rossellomorea aquimaris]WJV31917.1 helix-turn-helix transcriptional regulator [Rossellomorea sp. AcN35-11]